MSPETVVTSPRLLTENDLYLFNEGSDYRVMFVDGRPLALDLPENIAMKVTETAAPSHGAGTPGGNVLKEATLENGLTVQVPLFVAPGEVVSINMRTGRYLERVRVQHKKGA